MKSSLDILIRNAIELFEIQDGFPCINARIFTGSNVSDSPEIIPTVTHEYLEICFLLEGAARINLNGESGILHGPALMVIPSGVMHHAYLRPLNPATGYETLEIDLKIDKGHCVVFSSGYNPETDEYPWGELSPYLHINALPENARMVAEDLFSGEPFTRYNARNLLQNFYILIHRKAGAMHFIDMPETRIPVLLKQAIVDARKFVQDNFMKQITLSEVAFRVQYSSDHLSRVFKQVTGQTIPEMIQSLRLEKCARELRTSSGKISEIARNAGYENINNFIRHFHTQYGMSPTKYRLRNSQ